MDPKALVLVSGGLDSVYNLYAACEKWPDRVMALLFNYGQKAWNNERKATRFFTESRQIPLKIVDLSFLFKQTSSALISSKPIPKNVNIADYETSRQSAQKVWVSNRNGVFLNVAACLAESLGIGWIVPGFNSEEALTFPDNSQEYIRKMNACLQLSTFNGVQIHCFSGHLDKSQIVGRSLEFGIDMEKLWPCYDSGLEICGICESCKRFLRAKLANDIN